MQLTVTPGSVSQDQIVQAIVHLQHQINLLGPQPTLAPSVEREEEAARLTKSMMSVFFPHVLI